MSRLDLFLLGPPRIERDGAPIEVDTRKATALIAYLATDGSSREHSRDSLAAMFWPEANQARAHAALRRTLSALNKALAGDGLQIDRESVGLDSSADICLDADQFHRRLAECLTHGHPAADVCPACLPPLTEAVALYRDDFLSGFTLRDSPGFDDWQFFQAESLRRELASALEKLVRGHSAHGDFERAIACARRWLALDPLHEPAHRHLMQLYSRTGQRAAALRQYRECVRTLDQELGVSPLEETTRLYETIKEQRSEEAERQRDSGAAAQWAAEAEEVAAPQRRAAASLLPMVGRAAEWATLLQVYDSMDADGHFVVLEGEGGIGKTRLAEALLEHARGKRAVTIAARCYEGQGNLAYGPFVEGMRTALDQPDRAGRLEGISAHWLSEAARLLPELTTLCPGLPPAPPLDSPGAQSRFFEGVSQLLLGTSASRNGPAGLLFFDDLHWADEASLDLLMYLVRRFRGRPLCILVTWRGEQLPTDHRLRYLLAEAQRAGAATLVPLSRLSLPAVTELVRSALPLQAGSLVERLYVETEGLPFFLVEYLKTLANQTAGFPETQGLSGTDAKVDWSLPVSARGLLRSRLAAVSQTGRQLLAAAAIIGRSFDLDTLREASGRGEEETVAGLEALIVQGLANAVEGGEGAGHLVYDFSHEQLRRLVFEETGPARRRLLHRRVADTLALRGTRHLPLATRRLLAGQIAEHYRLGGREAEAANYFKQAGDYARALYANADAVAHFRSALALGHPEAAALHEALGDLQTLAGDYGAALTAYETAAALSAPEALGGLEHKLGNVYHRRGDWELAESHFQAALSLMGEDGSTFACARLYADWSLTAHHRGQTDRALTLARRALEFAQVAGDKCALAQVHNILGVLASSQRDLAQARHHLEHSLALAEASADPSVRVAALNNLALAFRANGEIEQALTLTENALALCASQGDRHREAALHNNLADLLHAAGRTEAAMSHLKQAVAIFAEIGEPGAMQPEIWKLTEW